MKKYVKAFCIRGLTAAWGGPVILALIWLVLKACGVVNTLTVNEVALGILSTTVMAFVAAGVSIVYQIENLPKAFAGLIQMAVLYADYLGFYCLNGWISPDKILVFTGCFIAGFVIIWFAIFYSIKRKVDKMNEKLNREANCP